MFNSDAHAAVFPFEGVGRATRNATKKLGSPSVSEDTHTHTPFCDMTAGLSNILSSDQKLFSERELSGCSLFLATDATCSASSSFLCGDGRNHKLLST